MTGRPTPSELAWPAGPDDADLAFNWAAGVTTQVLDWTWRAFDSLQSDFLLRVDWTRSLEQVERDLVQIHFGRIQVIFAAETNGFAAFYPSHEHPEFETRFSAQAKPPAYDLAFVATANPRWIWPLEAKVVQSPKAMAEYMKDVNDKFIAGVAAPFVGEAAMVGYLMNADADSALAEVSVRLNQPLKSVPEFDERTHRTSFHSRSPAPALRLHHMMMCIDRQ